MTSGTCRRTGMLLLLVVSMTTDVTAQLYSACPLDWQSNGDSCYLFVFDQMKNYQEAANACWGKGSALVSINNYNEQNYITGFLDSHARETAEIWYTSGQYISGSVKWNGDGTYTNKTDNTGTLSYWYDNFNPDVSENRVIFKYSAQYQTFRWTTVTGLDAYPYICEIPKSEVFRIVQQNRDFDYGTNYSGKSTMERGPEFIILSQDVVVVGDTWPAILECGASSKPQSTYAWYEATSMYGTQTFGQMTQVMSAERYTLTGGRMTISKPTEKLDAGVYQCKAENKFGSILAAPLQLSFGYLGQFSPNRPGAVTAKRSTGSYISCREPSAKPALAYNWYRDDAMNFIRPELNKYLFVSSNGNLYFSEVQNNDAGFYYCVVTLVAGFGTSLSTPQPPSRTSRAIQLIVANNTAQEYGPIIHPDFINVYPKPPMVGNLVQLECFAFGRMPMRYSWFREGLGLPEGTQFKYDNRVLIIPKARLNDGGNYTCKVEKRIGEQKVAYKSYVLTLEAKPYFVVPLGNMHADVGSELTWRCEVVAIPRATYSWYKNSKLLQRIPGEVEVRENVLVIKRLDATRDNGMYQCFATNQLGTSVSSAQLRVLSIKPTFAKYMLPSSLVASEGGNLTIRCTPEAAPAPDITWLHNGGPLSTGGRVEQLLDGTLHLAEVTMSDQGYYTCKASNKFGESQSSTQVLVYGGLHFIRKPLDTGGKVNTSVFLYCEISYNFNSYDLAYVWKFNGRIIDLHRNMHYRMGDAEKRGLYIINAQFQHTGTYECIGQTVTTSKSAAATVTIIGPPGEPAGVFVEERTIQNGSMQLLWTWNPLANHGFPVTYFDVEAWTDYTKVWEIIMSDIPDYVTLLPNSPHPMRRAVQVDNLQPHNSYKFRVRAKSRGGVGIASRPSEIYRVPMSAPRVAPLGVGGGGGSVGLLCMKWQALRRDQEGGMKFGYIVYWKLAEDKQAVPKFKDVGNVTTYCVEVGELMFYTMYAVQVQAYNSMGQGPMSPTGYAYSAEGMPDVRPTNVKYMPVNSTAIWVTWDKVPNTREAVKGKVLGYEIDYWKATTNDTRWFYRSYVYCDCGKALIIGLAPDTRYWVRVEVFTSAGKSTPSEKYKAYTFLRAASQFPQFVNVYGHGEHSIKVVWRGVNIKAGEDTVLGYRVIYWPVGDDIRIANSSYTDSPTDNEVVVYGLQQHTIYNLRVMAVSRGGDGKKSPNVFFTLVKGGAVTVNRANFDPSNSKVLIAGSPSLAWSWLNVVIMVLCTVGWSQTI